MIGYPMTPAALESSIDPKWLAAAAKKTATYKTAGRYTE